MKNVLDYLIRGVTGLEDFKIEEKTEDGFSNFTIITKPQTAGLIIGKGGSTIKAIRNVLKIKAILEKRGVSIDVKEEEK